MKRTLAILLLGCMPLTLQAEHHKRHRWIAVAAVVAGAIVAGTVAANIGVSTQHQPGRAPLIVTHPR